jgi:hypothetical protein
MQEHEDFQLKSSDIGMIDPQIFQFVEVLFNGPHLAYPAHIFIMLALLNFAMNIHPFRKISEKFGMRLRLRLRLRFCQRDLKSLRRFH